MELAVRDEGRGPAIVFIHGFPFDHSMWDAQVDFFCKDYRCVAVDLRGFGKSPVVPGTAAMEDMADDVALMLDKIDIQAPVTLCGMSMGGYVAWQFWLRHDRRLGRLILCDTRAVADSPDGAKARHDLAAKVLAEGTGIAWEGMKERLFAKRTLEERPAIVARMKQVVLANRAEGVAAALRGMAVRSDFSSRLRGINVPTLAVVGEHDAISPPTEMHAIAERITGAQVAVIPGAGHMSPVEDPDRFNAEVQRFLRRTQATESRTATGS